MNKRQPRRSSTAKYVEIEVDWDGAWISRPRIRCLKNALNATTIQIEAGDLHAAQVKTCPYRFFFVAEQRLLTMRGLVPRAVKVLERAGYQVYVQDDREFVAIQPDQRVLEKADQRDRELLESIAWSSEGYIKVEQPSDIPGLLALMCCLYPQVPILIPVRHRAAAERLHRQLSQRLLNVNVDLVLGGSWKWAGEVAVCTHASLAWYPFSGRRHVVLFPSLLDAKPLRRDDRPLTWQAANSYAFVAADERLSQFDELHLEATTGPEIHRYPGSSSPRPVIKTLSVQAPEQRRPCRLSPLERKRQCI